MKKIKSLEINVVANVKGVVNYNGKATLDKHVKKDDATGKQFDNIVYSKCDWDGVDFTSSNCIRHYLFKEEMPNQVNPNKEKENYISIYGSVYGILRGGLITQDKVGTFFKRNSAITVTDAFTSKKDYSIFIDTHTKSYKKEDSDKKEDSNKKESNFFHLENSGERQQEFKVIISARNLQFFDLEYPFIDVDKMLSNLIKSFESYGINAKNLKIAKYRETLDLTKTEKCGILLNDSLMNDLVKIFLNKLKNCAIYKRGLILKSIV